MANNTISQVEINGTTYDLLDANTLNTVSSLKQKVTDLEASVDDLQKLNLFNGKVTIRQEAITFYDNNGNAIGLIFRTAGKRCFLTYYDKQAES